MAISDTNKNRLNKMNRAAQDAELGTVIQDLQNATAPEISNLISNLSYRIIDGSVGKKTCAINGLTLITGGTGIADLTLAAPVVNSHVIIRLNTLTSGTVVITTADGVTLDGENNTITMDAIDDWIELVYAAENTWAIVRSNSVALSVVE
jgi:hypothetical protein